MARKSGEASRGPGAARFAAKRAAASAVDQSKSAAKTPATPQSLAAMSLEYGEASVWRESLRNTWQLQPESTRVGWPNIIESKRRWLMIERSSFRRRRKRPAKARVECESHVLVVEYLPIFIVAAGAHESRAAIEAAEGIDLVEDGVGSGVSQSVHRTRTTLSPTVARSHCHVPRTGRAPRRFRSVGDPAPRQGYEIRHQLVVSVVEVQPFGFDTGGQRVLASAAADVDRSAKHLSAEPFGDRAAVSSVEAVVERPYMSSKGSVWAAAEASSRRR